MRLKPSVNIYRTHPCQQGRLENDFKSGYSKKKPQLQSFQIITKLMIRSDMKGFARKYWTLRSHTRMVERVSIESTDLHPLSRCHVTLFSSKLRSPSGCGYQPHTVYLNASRLRSPQARYHALFICWRYHLLQCYTQVSAKVDVESILKSTSNLNRFSYSFGSGLAVHRLSPQIRLYGLHQIVLARRQPTLVSLC